MTEPIESLTLSERIIETRKDYVCIIFDAKTPTEQAEVVLNLTNLLEFTKSFYKEK